MVNDLVIYPNDSGTVVIVVPTGEIPTLEVARKDVPAGKPYLIISRDDLPQNAFDFPESLVADFSTPHGIAIGQEAWFAEQALKNQG